MRYAGLAVQTALYNALHNNVTLNIGGNDIALAVVSHTRESLFSHPFILIGVDSGVIDPDAGNIGQRRNVEISIWARGEEGRRLTKEAAARVIEIIDRTHTTPDSLIVDGYTVQAVEWVGDSSLPVDDDGETYQTLIDFSIQLEED